MSPLRVTEGEITFSVPSAGKPCKTWYKVVGNLKSGIRPLVLLHGGPGFTHNYLLSMIDYTSLYDIPTIFYDQIGNGRSTHLQEKKGDTSFWTVELFLAELDNLLAHLDIQDNYDILGQSWGGMLGACHAIRQPKGLNHLVIADSPASMKLWLDAQNLLRTRLPKDVQDTLTKHEKDGTTDSKEYEDAVYVFYQRHLCMLDPWPQELLDGMNWLKEDDTVYMTMNGPSEFHVIGSLKAWTVIDEVHKIKASTLLINGRYDEAQDSCVAPFFQNIPKVKWASLAESSHSPHWEERERFIQVSADFLKSS